MTPSVSIVNFEQVNAGWVSLVWKIIQIYYFNLKKYILKKVHFI